MGAVLKSATITAISVIIVALISSATTYVTTRQTTTVTVTSTVMTNTTYPQSAVVPNVVGQDYRTANLEISSERLTPRAIPVPGSNSKENIVFSQDPEGGTPVVVSTDVYFNYSIGNHTQAYFTSPFWGQGVKLVSGKLPVEGQLVNAQDLGNQTLYLVSQTSSLTFGTHYWVESKPSILPNGTWSAQISFGLEDLSFGSAFQLDAVLTSQPLTVGVAINSLPVNSTVTSIPLYYATL
jgi:hypothetical protein